MLDLFEELEQELNEANACMSSFKKDMKSFLSTQSQSTVSSQQSQTYEHVVQTGPKHSFPKASRFKEKKLSESIFGESVISQAAPPQEFVSSEAYAAVQQKKPAVIFSKSQRFSEPKKEEPVVDYDPNYDFVRKQTPMISIAPEQQPSLTPFKLKMLQSGMSQAELDELETQASMSQVGPGSYNIKYDQIETKRSVALPKGSRFIAQAKEEQTELNPKYDAIYPKPPIAKIAPKKERSRQLQERDKLRQMEEEQRAAQYLQRPLDIDAGIRANQPKTIIMKSFKEISATVGSKHRRFLIMKLMDELKFAALGPGAYEILPPKAAPCTVIYRPHSAEGRRVPNQERPVPGPDYYYSKDDLIRTTAVVHSFGIEPRYKKIKKEDLDMRPDLEINEEQVKTRQPAAIIQPEQQHFSKLPNADLQTQQNVGPGVYDPSMKLVEQRTDKGAVALKPLNEQNDRIKIIDPVGKDREFHDYQELLLPSLDAVKPEVTTFKYHEPVEQKPIHVPDKEIFPENWQYYDANLDAVREQVGQTVPHFGGKPGRQMIEFLRYQEDLEMFKSYMKRRDRVPEIGEYNPNYKRIDKDPQVVDFERFVEKDIDPITKPEGAVDGDNLILDPKLPKPHLPNINFEKQLERPEGPQPKEGPELDLEPKYDLVKPKVVKIPDFQKQLDRPPSPKPKEIELAIEPNFKPVEPRVKGNANFEKQTNREDDPRFNQKVDDRPLVVEPKMDAVQPKQKCAVKLNSGPPRFPKKTPQEQNPIPPPMPREALEKAERATRPNIPSVNMRAQSARKMSLKKK